ncbi:NAD(P)H-dependent oxidoreductase [Cohnella xylanilytica]|uniref:NAD(P)H-dependent oxidoreductase n=1 Tax=Cohnella xylanilytica TaxID=557555 RepID=A0A841TT61_9BACL|nr:NAD(P)H-dependent oxidoreductase [Cohnella xylanilytica]MBB6690052.1 NAD(P)H-dependent oxidoreductase [Cohnella xylanilytica]
MKVAAIVGSIRQDSYNLKIARYIQNRYKSLFQLDILNIRDLPFYDQDIEFAPPQPVIDFKTQVAAADAVLWVTPEYNSTIPGVLANAIDWLSRVDRVMIGKPSWIVGSSMGLLGSVKAQGHLRDVLFSSGISSPLLPGNEVYIGLVHEKIDEKGELTDEPTIKYLDLVADNFVTWMKEVGKLGGKANV